MDDQVSKAAVLNVNTALPTAVKITVDSYYVRECYSKYYDMILELLYEPLTVVDYVTVTGTPGIGISVFYQYFFTRFRQEYPNIPIVTASFTKKQKLKRCVVFPPKYDGQDDDQENAQEYEAINLSLRQKYPNAIYLYDGPPENEPACSKMVTFSSPNYDWMNEVRKDRAHCPLYMPVWELSEMMEAVKLLNFNISIDDLRERYRLFGGEVLYSLETISMAYQQGITSLKEAMKKIKTIEDIQACFDMENSMDQVVHRVVYYVPDYILEPRYPAFATIRIASRYVHTELYKKHIKIHDQERQKLLHWLENAGKASSFYGWLFEALAHDEILKGGDFTCKLLDETSGNVGDGVNLRIVEQVSIYERIPDNFTASMVYCDVYHIPKSQSFKSIDSFYCTRDNKIIMFQITKAVNHSVNALGLIDFFANLQLLNDIKEDPTRAWLVFVVPSGTGSKYKRQEIVTGQRAQGENWMKETPVRMIPGIGPKLQTKLNEREIQTCLQLWEKRDNAEFQREINCLIKWKNTIDTTPDLSFLKSIPQFVLEMDVESRILMSDSVNE